MVPPPCLSPPSSTSHLPNQPYPFRSKDDGSGETIGKDSGRTIINILNKNPKKDAEPYDQDDMDHMRNVVAYCKRHLAQEEMAKQDTDSKSYKSPKNWGHNALKA
ncbi:hypothetical protein BU26DRAFT_514960 [Trematosphaeria pertusa]|uniref:Uncharacterized protein n=1 Tax=Trematosphaeria pertusa TaxID=390896 RepID=A0A6A6J042_9PLEO|nr:uncharacterized protein BU26DRAFT_514960 [Trematosphaeria pertusa]KAF2255210.1 hypothetical protein BU26DRAFT_514960 [Trematosphaeria pertusa]